MNFIVGFLIYHAEEYIAFWLFITLIEDYELKNIFSDGKIKKIIRIAGLN